MGANPEQSILPVTGGRALDTAMALYERVFPAWEREPRASLEQRIASGRYHCLALSDAASIVGMSVTDCRPGLDCSVLTFLAVDPGYRGRGLGGRLLETVVRRFRADGPGQWLFVEAETAPARLYQRYGFRRLGMAYHVPHYGDDGRCRMMALMALPRHADATASVDGIVVAAMIRDAFIDGYGLEPGDPRLTRQLARIPQSVELEGC